jgi:hypothetical protein
MWLISVINSICITTANICTSFFLMNEFRTYKRASIWIKVPFKDHCTWLTHFQNPRIRSYRFRVFLHLSSHFQHPSPSRLDDQILQDSSSDHVWPWKIIRKSYKKNVVPESSHRIALDDFAICSPDVRSHHCKMAANIVVREELSSVSEYDSLYTLFWHIWCNFCSWWLLF